MNKLKLIKALTRQTEPQWYRMQDEGDIADIWVYDEISWFGIKAQEFVKDLNAIKAKTIRLHINSPGGSVFDGVAIYNSLKEHKAKVETYIEGLAASIASVIALAGDKVYMAENAFFMIHNAWALSIGEAKDLRKTADLLEKMDGVLVSTYAKKTGKNEGDIKKLMDDETWFTAIEAKEAGFIDEITDEIEAEAKYDIDVFDNAPEELLERFKKNATDKAGSVGNENNAESMRMQLELIAI